MTGKLICGGIITTEAGLYCSWLKLISALVHESPLEGVTSPYKMW